jgi:MFS family permease
MTTVAGARATYRGLFGHREFRLLVSAHVVSMLGTMVADVALTVLVYQRTGSPALSALTFTVGFIPYLLGGALLSGLVDRWPPRGTMISCDLASAVVFTAMTLPGLPVGGLLGLAFAAGLIAPVFGGMRAALLPALLGSGPTYVLGRSVMRMVAQGSQIAGFAAGGLLLAGVGAQTALLIDAASFLASAMVIRIGLGVHPAADVASTPLVRDSLGGLRAVLADGPTRRLLMLRWFVPSCALAPEALAAPYVHALHAGQSAVGLYLTATPVGMLIGNLLAGRLLSPAAQRRIVVPAALLTTVPLLMYLGKPSLAIAFVLLLIVGFGTCHDLALDGLLVQIAPEALRSRALAVDQAGLMFWQGVGFGAWGAVGQLLPLRIAIPIAGVAGLTVVLAWKRSSSWRWGE